MKILIMFIGLVFMTFANGNEKYELVNNLKTAFATGDAETIANYIEYPLYRSEPLYSIKDKRELIRKFNQIFEKNHIDEIANSSIEKEWSVMGYKGIMFRNGLVWLNSEGKIISWGYIGNIEKAMLQSDKNRLHSSIQEYDKNVLSIDTQKFHIRIDEIAFLSYRYTAWKKGKRLSQKPDVVFYGGVRIYEGSAGNGYFLFKNGSYEYRVTRTLLYGEKYEPDHIEVYRDNQLISSDEILDFSL